MATLRELFDEAQHLVSMYRSPNIDEFQKRLGEVFVAMHLGDLEHDKITKLTEHDGQIQVETAWMVRQCAQTSDFEFPSSVIDAEDPVKAATLHYHEQWVVRCQIKVSGIERDLLDATTKLMEAKFELAKLNSPQG